MRILSYNIHGCVGRDGREDPDRVLELIREADADIVGLQEVYHHDALDRSFLEALETLPYSSVIYGKTMRKPEADYGNLLLLRNTPHKIQRIELPHHQGEPRGLICADTHWHGQPLRVLVTHLDLGIAERKRQTDRILQQLPPRESKTACILMGDLNEWLPLRPYFRKFVAQFDHCSRARTFPIKPALFALDRIALRGHFNKVHFHTLDNSTAKIASDHRPLLCELN